MTKVSEFEGDAEPCWLCDEQWPMSRDLSGVHDIDADGVYGTANCLKPSERAKRIAREEADARRLAEFEQGEIASHGAHFMHRAGCPSCRAEATRR